MKIWTPDERRLLRSIYPQLHDDEVAKRLDRSLADVTEEAGRLALAKDKRVFSGTKMPHWTDEQVDRLIELYPDHSNVEIARLLGRSEASVMQKGSRLGLVKSGLRKTFAASECVRSRRIHPVKQDEG